MAGEGSDRLVHGQEGVWILHTMPVLLSFGMMVLRSAINPDPLKGSGADLVFGGLGFDVWAVQTLISDRQVVYGGFFRFPRVQGWWTAKSNQILWVALLGFAHVLLALLAAGRIAKNTSTETPLFWVAAFVTSVVLPIALVLGRLPGRKQDRYAT